MAEYIERSALLDKAIEEKLFVISARDAVNDEFIIRTVYKDLAEVVRSIPAADVAPVVHGHWIPISDGAWAECSECGEACDVSDNGGMTAFELFCDCYKHCPNCGAKMDGGAENV